MAAPPVDAGALKLTVACPSPAVADAPVGAPGTTALTAKVRDTVGAGRYDASPAWSASIVQVPAVMNVSVPPEVIVHTPVVDDENDTVRLDVAVAEIVGVVPKLRSPGLRNVIVWDALGVTEFEAEDAGLVPAALSAVTVNV